MPRPGPRPYECVRRAWHSHRHQPMRGLIIRQIFRLVHENHCPATKKNKEWQEKLPIVVLKAEEIMYSKANSEAEYTDLDTLWDRVNDAIDTIIRKDESTETGELLPPCVEAALNLGCVAVRASRSQMHSNPRTYLKPTIQDSRDGSPKVLDENIKIIPTGESPGLVFESTSGCVTSNIDNRIPPDDSRTPSNVGSVYPLYYGTMFQPQVSKSNFFQEPQKPNPVILGVPVEVGRLQNLFVSSGRFQEDSRDKNWLESQTGCDLSLRLGLFPELSSSTGKSNEYGNNSVDRVSQDGRGKCRDKESLFFPLELSSDDPSRLHMHTSRWNLEGEGQSVKDVGRKRKISHNADPICNHFAGQMKRPGR